MSDPAHTWTKAQRVREHELDATGRLSLVSLCSYLQDAASSHANELSLSVERLGAQGLTWVLARLSVAIERRPGKDEPLTFSTWPSGVDGLFATRDFRIVDDGGHSLVRATTAWMMLDVERRRPVRLTDEVLALSPRDARRSLIDDFKRLPAIGGFAADRPVLTGWSDLDVNRHVNHVRYVAWMLDAVPGDIVACHEPASLDLHFRSETGVDRSLTVLTERIPGDPGMVIRQNLVDSETAGIIAEASSTWRPVP